ncbi:MAG: immunity 21 family protein [Chloroflexi bacterium]|nr:immunity 21 family protein [Chloroflexota bacterium]
MTENAMRWITSEGGPLLLLDERSLNEWGGVIELLTGPPASESWSPGGKPTDYDRACSVEGYVGLIPVGTQKAVVLGGEPLRTAWMPGRTMAGGMFVRWFFGESEVDFLNWANRVPKDTFRSDGEVAWQRRSLVLFDAAVAGRNVKKRPEEYLSIEFEPGIYEIKTAVYQPDAQTCMVVHRFEPSS